MRALAGALARRGYVLRTGGAPGADQAFVRGALQAGGACELYLPWPSYERDALAAIGDPSMRLDAPTREASAVAAAAHPAWGKLSSAARRLQARNSHQILGRDLRVPARFVVCWTAAASLNGSTSAAGGTGQALRIAAARGISVVNLAIDSHRTRAERFICQPGT